MLLIKDMMEHKQFQDVLSNTMWHADKLLVQRKFTIAAAIELAHHTCCEVFHIESNASSEIHFSI